MPIECPICSKDDAVQKVSSIVSGGTSTGSFSGPSGGIIYTGGKWGTVGGYSHLSGNTSTDLASMLTLPREPHKSSKNGGVIIMLLLACGGAVWCPLAALLPLVYLATSIGNSDFIGLALSLIALCFDVVIGVVYVYLWVISYKYSQREKIRLREKFIREKAIWDEAIIKWDRLYYCHRDDIVFDMQTKEKFPPSQTINCICKY